MNFVRTLIISLSLSFVGASSSSIGSEFDSSLSCSKFHFEEKILEKLVRLEHKMQIFEEKIDAWEKLVTSNLDEMNNIKKQTEIFVQSVQDTQLQDQTRFNQSYQEIVEHFRIQATNKTDVYVDQMNSLLESLSSKIEVFTEAEKKRESVLELMQFTIHQDLKRFNVSYAQMVKTFKVNSNKTLQELVVNQQKDYGEMVNIPESVAFSAYRTSSKSLSDKETLKFDKVWTNVGNGYQPSTGIFTAPRAGLYHFTAVVMSVSGRELFMQLYRNTVTISGSGVTGVGHNTGTFDVVFVLQQGDEVYIASGSSGTIYSNTNAYLTFSGYSIT